MRKEKYGSSELSIETTHILVQKGSESRVNRNKSRNICNYCKEVRHWARECKKKRTDSKRKGKQNNVVEAGNEVINEEAFMSSLYVSCGSIVWYVDSSASAHLSHE